MTGLIATTVDFAADPDSRRSMTGYLWPFMADLLAGKAVATEVPPSRLLKLNLWQENIYIVVIIRAFLKTALIITTYLRSLLHGFGFSQTKPTELSEDNVTRSVS